MFQLHFQQHVWDTQAICSETTFTEGNYPVLVQRALDFCRAWLTGVQEVAMHTSGSTGKPKLITLTRTQLQASAQGTCRFFQLTTDDVALVCLDPAYIAGKMMLLRAMEAEMKTILVEPTRNPLEKLLSTHPKPSFFAFVPLQLHEMLVLRQQEQMSLLEKARAILVGGAPISRALRNEIAAARLPVYQTYGMTETASHIALRKIPEETEYTTLSNVEIATDVRGCLQVKGVVTNGQWLTTNDLVSITNSRQFRWVGRYDTIINTGGVKIPSEAIEEAIQEKMGQEAMPRAEAVVITLPDEHFGEAIGLLVEGEPLGKTVEAALIAHVKENVHQYAAPKYIFYVDELPRTDTQKVDRRAIKKMIEHLSKSKKV